MVLISFFSPDDVTQCSTGIMSLWNGVCCYGVPECCNGVSECFNGVSECFNGVSDCISAICLCCGTEIIAVRPQQQPLPHENVEKIPFGIDARVSKRACICVWKCERRCICGWRTAASLIRWYHCCVCIICVCIICLWSWTQIFTFDIVLIISCFVMVFRCVHASL